MGSIQTAAQIMKSFVIMGVHWENAIFNDKIIAVLALVVYGLALAKMSRNKKVRKRDD